MATEVNHDHRCQRQRKLRLTCALNLLLTCLATLILLPTPTHGQSSPAPLPVSGPAFARSSTRLYIQGGTFANINYGQFFSLDLAVGWNTTTPAWTQLNDGPQQNIYPAVFSADQQTMITFHSGGATFAYRYSVAKGQWTPSTLQVQYGGYQGVGAVTDPNTGLVYLAGGYTDGSRNTLNIYNFNTDTIAENPMPAASTVFPNRAYYTNVWSQKRGSILYFGGYNTTLKPIPNGNVVSEYVPSTQTWSTLSTTGTPPTMRADHCMTSNDDGSLVIIYGGRPVGNAPFSGEVFMLDTVNLVWKLGTPGPPRLYTTCTVAGDQLIIWGGVDGNDVVAPAPAYIYSISSNNWITQYVPPESYIAARRTESAVAAPTPTDANGSTSPTRPSGSMGSKPTSNNAGAIAGGVVGGVAILCAGVLFFVFRRRRNRGSPVSTTGDQDDMREVKHQPPTAQGRGDDELERLRLQLQNQQEQLELQRRLLQLQQQQQQHMPLQPQQPHQYQDMGYNYQPPIFYSAAATSEPAAALSPCPLVRSSPGLMNTLPAHSGYVQGNTQYVGAQPAVFSPLLTTTATPTTLLPDKTPMPRMASGAKHDSNYWEERAPGNPHAIIET
ncbi:Multiple epidermal growth factor-like domains protein 8 [Mortierella alpina]|nr:Multiple epidermal growth factor-like domains protein 8 [Mortierella alpina]